jgi:O-methyltransferase
MQITLFQIVQLILIGVILVYLMYYVYTILFDKKYQPKAWREAFRNGKISRQLQVAEKHYPDKVRFFNFWFQVERLKKENVSGDFAELGVYEGDSARLINLMDPQRPFHLFDTFEGFRQTDLNNETGKAASYTTKNFADTSLEKVKSRLNAKNFIFHPGYFPDTTAELGDQTYALVNMDADLYNPTHAGLHYFYHRLSPGGVIIIHDYNPDWPGIMKAVDDFVMTIPESLIVLADQDSSVMIVRNK